MLLSVVSFFSTYAQFATSGSGANKNILYWLSWNDASFSDGIQSGDSETFSLPGGVTITATFSSTTGGSRFIPVDMDTWSGALLYQGYETTTSTEAFYNRDTGGASFSTQITFSATDSKGNAFNPTIIFGDAESTGPLESITATTNGSNWTTLEALTSTTYSVSGIDGTSQTATITDTRYGNPLFYSTNVTQLNVGISAGGARKEGFALAVYYAIDYGDAPDSYGTPSTGHLDYALAFGSPDLYIGSTVDFEIAGIGSPGATTDGADEDGLTNPQSHTTASAFNISFPVVNNTSSTANVSAFLSSLGSTDFSTASVQSTTVAASTSKTINFSFTAPTVCQDDSLYLRLRISNDDVSSPTGYVNTGEVEDYLVIINQNTPVISLSSYGCAGSDIDFGQPSKTAGTGFGSYPSDYIFSWTGPGGIWTSSLADPAPFFVASSNKNSYTGTYTVTVTDTIGCSDASSVSLNGNNCSTLPIMWVAFTSKSSPDGVILDWSVVPDKESEYYLIERASDQQSWETISETIKINDHSEAIKNYSFTDPDPLQDINYYRIKEVDFDGSYTYSQVVFCLNHQVQELVYYANNQLIIRFYSDTLKQVTVFDQLGIEWYRHKGVFYPGELKLDLSSANLKGYYLIQLIFTNSESVQRIVITKDM